jgi:hypothetical protein
MSPVGRTLVVTVLLAGSTLGCNAPSLVEEARPEQRSQKMIADNGLTIFGLATNGLATNGLATNGLATNGLATNGLATNGLESSTFSDWFSADPSQRNILMKYLIGCALPEGEVRTYTDSQTETTYSWSGRLGLTPNWATGEVATEVEEQLISACLAAHANPYGLKVPISILGRNSEGVEIPYTEEELFDYPVREACFFGNLFRDQGLYAGNDGTQLASFESTDRGCGLSTLSTGENPVCPEIARVGTCDTSLCELDETGTYYTQCTYNGVVYRPMTTRILVESFHVCGDGVCDVSEQCGQGETPDSCSDCGPCR